MLSLRDALMSDLPTTGRVIERAISLVQPFTWQAQGDGHYRLDLSVRDTNVWLRLVGGDYQP